MNRRFLKKFYFQFGLSVIWFLPGFAFAQSNYYQNNTKVYTAQMHLHSWSNHNGSSVPASIQMNSYYAQKTNTNIIWWTEHRFIYNFYKVNYAFSLTNAKTDSPALNIVGLNGNDFTPDLWQSLRNTNNTHVSVTDSSFTVSVHADQTNTWDYNYYSPQGTKGDLGSLSFVRSVADGATLNFTLSNITGMNSMTSYVLIRIILSYHIYGDQFHQEILTYNLYNLPVHDTMELTDDSTELVTRTIPGDGKLELNFLTDAVLLPDYEDNCIQSFSAGLAASHGASPQVTFSKFYISTQINDPDSLYLINKQWHDKMAQRYHITDYTGMEFTPCLTCTHLSAFLPDNVGYDPVLFSDTTLEENAEYSTFAGLVQKKSGLITIDHPLGAEDNDTAQSDSLLNYRIDTTYHYLKNYHFFGTRLIEIGYKLRGGCDLAHYLLLWDKLNSNRGYMYGEGVSDQHGGTWINYSNDLVNFIWSPDSSQTHLINALNNGRFFFGDDQSFQGNFYFQAGKAVMGDTAQIQHDSVQLKVFISAQSQQLKYVVVQALINKDSSDSEIHYLLNSKFFDLANPPELDISKPCFVRVEVLDKSGNPIVISNPIFFSDGNIFGQQPGASNNPITAINVYPNPAHSAFTLTWLNNASIPITIKLVDASGKTIQLLANNTVYSAGNHSYSFPADHILNGLYYLEFISGNYHSEIKFVIN